jgi:Rieske Fe-S protein
VLTEDRSSFPIGVAQERRLDRRRFLWTAGSAVVLAATGDLLGRRFDADTRVPPPLAQGAVSDLPVGEARAFTRAEGTTLAVRLAESEVVAFDRRCPHLGCPVVWAAARGRFECPCHHAAFDARSGAVLFGPPRRGLTAVAVRP